MKAILLTAALFGLMPTLGHAAAAPAPATSANAIVDQAVLDLSAQQWKWMSDRNVEALDALCDDKAVFVHMGGTMTKLQELKVISSGGIQYKRADVESVSIEVIGDTAIVLSKLDTSINGSVRRDSGHVGPFGGLFRRVLRRQSDVFRLQSSYAGTLRPSSHINRLML